MRVLSNGLTRTVLFLQAAAAAVVAIQNISGFMARRRLPRKLNALCFKVSAAGLIVDFGPNTTTQAKQNRHLAGSVYDQVSARLGSTDIDFEQLEARVDHALTLIEQSVVQAVAENGSIPALLADHALLWGWADEQITRGGDPQLAAVPLTNWVPTLRGESSEGKDANEVASAENESDKS